MALLPLALSGVLAWATGSAGYLLFGLLSPVSLIAGAVADRRSGRRSHRALLREHAERKAAIEADARGAALVERDARRHALPGPVTVRATATGPGRGLWERRRDDPDFLSLRVGCADVAADVTLEDPDREEHRRRVPLPLPDVPVGVPLARLGVLGVAGPAARPLARWLLLQAAVLHAPADLQVVVLGGRDSAPEWEWARWLPHCRPAAGQDCAALLAFEDEDAARRLAELAALVARRSAAREPLAAAQALGEPAVLVVVDGARRLRTLPGLVQVLREGPGVRVHVLCVEPEERLLPAECRAVVSPDPDGLVRVAEHQGPKTEAVLPDLVAAGWCEEAARGLAPLRAGGGDGEEAQLPAASRLLDVVGLSVPTAEGVRRRWARADGRLLAVLGESVDGPFALDVGRDGPHALVAGTTGAGKSELLQTLVATLAASYPPDRVAFVLVDYKGGAAFADCAALPHTVGMVTDLDGALVERALASLRAELARREHLLAAAGAKDVDAYLRSRNGTAGEPLPRLLIVIDEFASLVRELPDFVTGLVDIAQRGRSLGISLVMATQRPSGAVSPEIRANTNVRIALRMTDGAESSDVIDAPDAGRIPRQLPGRAYARLGHASLVPFQAARVGGPAPPAGSEPEPEPWAVPISVAALARPLPARPAAAGPASPVTDLSAFVDAVRAAADADGCPPPRRPWLPPLPATLALADLAEIAAEGAAAYGLVDLPAEQAQLPAVVDLAAFGHLFVVGAPRSGRSTALRTLAAALATAYPSSDVHLYALDCGGGGLQGLTALPHCGAVVGRTEPERAGRLLAHLSAEVRRRQDALAAGGYADVAEQRLAEPADRRLPHVVLLLDRWEGFVAALGEADGGRLVEEVTALLREGASAGVHVVAAGDRSLLLGRVGAASEDKLLLRLADTADYALGGVPARSVPPDGLSPGRALRADAAGSVQIALLDGALSGRDQAAALERLGARLALRDAAVPAHRRVPRVDALPARVSFDAAWDLRPSPLPARWAMVGVGGNALAAHGPDLTAGGGCFLVAGPPRSGRSTVLLAMARSLLAAGSRLVVAAPRASPLRSLAGQPGVVAVLPSAALEAAELGAALIRLGAGGVLLVDDAELLRDCPARETLLAAVQGAGDGGPGVVAAGTADEAFAGFSGWQVELRKSRRGVLLSPQGLADGDLIGVRLPRGLVGGPVQPGRALAQLGDGELLTLRVPLE
nr:FtsK/SpoIIIE domain-containing protein [Motilibacter deserti]